MRHRPQVVEGAPALVDDDRAGPEALDDLICVAGALTEDDDRGVAPGQQVVQFLRIALLIPRDRGEAVKRESAFSQASFSISAGTANRRLARVAKFALENPI